MRKVFRSLVSHHSSESLIARTVWRQTMFQSKTRVSVARVAHPFVSHTVAHRLESHARAQADVALARARGRGDIPEGSGGRDVGSGVGEVGMIQRVQGFTANLELDALGDRKRPEQ